MKWSFWSDPNANLHFLDTRTGKETPNWNDNLLAWGEFQLLDPFSCREPREPPLNIKKNGSKGYLDWLWDVGARAFS